MDPVVEQDNLTLQDRTLLEATRQLRSLGTVLDFCNQNPAYNSSCTKSDALWKSTIKRIFSSDLVEQRNDILAGEWHLFAQLLASGVNYEYGVRWNSTNDNYSEQALPYASIKEDDRLMPPDSYYFKFTIPVVRPLAGSKGFFMRLSIDGRAGFEDIYGFVVGPDVQANAKFAVNWLAERFYNYHVGTKHINKADFFTNANYHEDTGIRQPFPSLNYFAGLIMGNGIDPADGRIHQNDAPWFVLYGPPNDPKYPVNYYTETNYDIVPVSF